MNVRSVIIAGCLATMTISLVGQAVCAAKIAQLRREAEAELAALKKAG